MKSIIEEASSVAKAIEKGWIEANKPQEFSVKVFQEAEKNFIGLTTKSAKIAIFYSDKKAAPTQQAHAKPAKTKKNPSAHATTRSNKAENNTKPSNITEKKEKIATTAWSSDMLSTAEAWLKSVLHALEKPNKPFSLDTKRYYLKINFDSAIMRDTEKERILFKSLAHLMLQMLRNKYKKNLHGFKIVITSNSQ